MVNVSPLLVTPGLQIGCFGLKHVGLGGLDGTPVNVGVGVPVTQRLFTQ